MKIIIILLLATLASPAYAKAYKCEIEGKTTYQQKPCKEGEATKTLDIRISKEKYLEQKLEKNEREIERVSKQFEAETDKGKASELLKNMTKLELEQIDLMSAIDEHKNKNAQEKFVRLNKVAVGMTDKQVIRAIGKPTSINSSTRNNKKIREQWVYGGEGKTRYVYLVDKKVTSLQW